MHDLLQILPGKKHKMTLTSRTHSDHVIVVATWLAHGACGSPACQRPYTQGVPTVMCAEPSITSMQMQRWEKRASTGISSTQT